MDIKKDALGLEASKLEEIVKAVEVKESAKEANRAVESSAGSVKWPQVTQDRLKKCPNATKRCANCKITPWWQGSRRTSPGDACLKYHTWCTSI